jgi:hypothetical protein
LDIVLEVHLSWKRKILYFGGFDADLIDRIENFLSIGANNLFLLQGCSKSERKTLTSSPARQ